jgi:predicted ATPase/DNA-binding SARP family transcriptional activator
MLVVKLLGQFSVQLNDLLIEIPSRPAQTLFAFLALQPDTAFRREKLAGLIWPDANESNARSNLRHALWRIRKALGEQEGQHYFPADDLTVMFSAEPGCWTDAVLLAGKSNPISSTLEEQVAAYHGELLPGFYDDWVTIERERLQAAFESKIEALIDRLSREKNWSDVIEWAEHWIKFGTAPEPAYRALMIAHARLSHKAKVKETYQRCVEALQREFGVEPAEETQELYQQLMATRPLARPPAPIEPAAPRHNLPTPATPLVGRETELAEITDRLVNDPSCRLLTIVGPGGIGKTRLALQAATQSLDQFDDGTFFVSFEALTAAEAIAPTILQALSSAIQDQKDPRAQLIDYVRDKNLLLVLDNLEHLLEGAAVIGEVLSAAPAIKIIVTSRERLHLQWEWLYEAPGLAYPADSVENVESYSAVQLFLQTARRMRARFALAEEQPYVIRICQLVEGLPLGLELAASWVRVMSCREIAEQIDRNLDVLSAQLADVPDRHRSARAVFEYSWSLLAPEEQQVFMKLAAFPGGFRREAAERVAGAPLSLLFTLIDKSLLRASANGRYDMHSLLHQYVSEKAALSSQTAAIQTRLINYYLDYARQHQHDYLALEEERINVMACLEMAHHNWQAQVVLDYVEALGEMWSARGHWSDARTGYAWACDAARAHDDDAAVAKYLFLWGNACIEQGDYAEAHKHLQAAWQLSQKLGNILNAARAASQLAHIAIEQTDWTLAEELLANSLSVCQEHQDFLGVAEILYRQARVHYYRSEDALALSAAQRAWSLIADTGQYRLSVDVLCMLADLATYSQHDYGQAEAYAQQALRLAEASHDDSQLPSVLVCLADIHRKLQQFTLARQEAERSMALVKRMGDRKTQAQVWHCLSRIDYNCGQHALALTENDEGLRLCRELNDRLGEALMLEHRGHILTATGKQAEARRAWSEALSLAEALQHPLTDLLHSYLD